MNHKSAVIFGGGLSGLVSANICSHLGIDSILIEKTNSLGGGNKSIKDKKGNIFDCGYHALDHNRSLLTTKFFERVLRNNFHKLRLSRGIVIQNSLLPYNESLANWPIELQNLFKKKLLKDNIQEKLDFKSISKVYGKKFTKLAFDEILKSYPSINWSLKHRGKKEYFFGTVYPWFFPKNDKISPRTIEWEHFHDVMRQQSDHHILYPKKDGFQGFTNAILNDIDTNYCKIKKNVKNLKINIDPKTKKIRNLNINGNYFTANLYLWCNSPISLAKILNLNLDTEKIGKPQKIIFGNFVFEKNVNLYFHEILVGSLQHQINRISFPGKIRKKKNNLVQIEFSFPENQFNLNPIFWKTSWLKSLQKLKIIKPDNLIKNFTFISETRGFVSKYDWEILTNFYRKKIMIAKGDNIAIPSFNLGPENINRVVPDVIINTLNSLHNLNGI